MADLPLPVDLPLHVSLVLFLAQWPIGLASLAAWYITRRWGAFWHLHSDFSVIKSDDCMFPVVIKVRRRRMCEE